VENHTKRSTDLYCRSRLRKRGDVTNTGALAAKENRKVILKGFDANPHIVKYATDHSQEFNNISFEAINVFRRSFTLRNLI
jgi:hypothetical protein